MKRIIPVAALAAGLVLPVAAGAQLADSYLGASGPAFDHWSTSGRLAALGGMLVAVPDESRELNLFDFGANVAGLGTDRDAWSADVWGRSSNRLDRTEPGRRREIGLGEQGLLFVSRPGGHSFALGAEVAHSKADLSGLDEDQRALTGDVVKVLYSQALLPRVRIGGHFAVSTENEDLESDYVFAIHHESQVSAGGLGVGYEATPWLDLGATGEYTRSTIDGASSSAFHRDLYLWERPLWRFGGQAVARLGSATAGLAADWASLDGREEVEANWSDRFPLNPTHQNISWRGPTMKEDMTSNALAGRIDWEPAEGTALGAVFAAKSESYEVREKENFESSVPATDEERDSRLVAVGASRRILDDRLLVAAEGRFESRSTEGASERETWKIEGSRMEIALGGEYYYTRAVPLRLAYLRTAEAQDEAVGEIQHTGNGFTVGIGYSPRGGILQLDAGYRFLKETPDDSSKSMAEEAGLGLESLEVQSVVVSARLLF